MATLLARSRAMYQALAFARPQQTGYFGSALRFVSSTPALSDNDKSPTDGKSGQGNSAVVDPEQDATIKEVLAIPVPKPLIPGTALPEVVLRAISLAMFALHSR
jgi:hypothetical protein